MLLLSMRTGSPKAKKNGRTTFCEAVMAANNAASLSSLFSASFNAS